MADMMAYLALVGKNFDVDYVFRRTGINLCQGIHSSLFQNVGNPYLMPEWYICTETISSFEIHPLLEHLIALVPCSNNVLREVAVEYGAKWKILLSITIRDLEIPAIIIPSEFFRFAGEINADLDIDTRFLF